ncbi:MAG: TetR family transcriptional regulator C-terminal domain-containing protein [Pseudomonadales bacterium]|nr:TetR family transcriptional regulator C-terminal domain-containing protein [Pseudomonadales bacterium]
MNTIFKTRIQKLNEKRIMDAALEIFAQYGYEGATVDKIAAKAGISKPNLHYYYDTKSDLYIAVLQRTLETWLAPLKVMDREGDPGVELRKYISQKVDMCRLMPDDSRVFANEMLHGAPFLKGSLESDVRDLVMRKTEVIQYWIDTGKLKKVNPYHLIFLIWASTQHYADFGPQVKAVMSISRLTKQHFKEIEDSLCQIILGGILP